MKQVFHCPATVSPHLLGIKRKKSYNTREEARKADRNAVPYQCEYCNKWHLRTARIK